MQESIFYINRQLVSKNPEQAELQAYKDVIFQDNKIKVTNLEMKVTTHRILLFSSSEHCFLIEGHKILEVSLRVYMFISQNHGILWSKQYYIKVKTKDGKLKFFLDNYKEAEVNINSMIKNKVWEKSKNKQSEKPQMYSGLFKKIGDEKQKIDSNAQKVGASFTSFQSLFENLRDIKQAMAEMKKNTADSDDPSEVKDILKDIGFVQVVSKEETGKEYYQKLAQDLYGICQNALFKKYGGIVSLLDLFYFYNMKRQMELVSPEELLKACKRFEKFGFNAKLLTYPNNIKVIESTSFDECKDFTENFKQFFSDFKTGYSAQQISRKKGQPLVIIEIKLKKALRRGDIAIDNRIEGDKYYKNLLLTV